jgi:hypothetical protein
MVSPSDFSSGETDSEAGTVSSIERLGKTFFFFKGHFSFLQSYINLNKKKLALEENKT